MRVTGRSPCLGPRCPVVRLVDLPLGRLATRDRQGDLDRQAAWTIQRLLTGDGPARAGPGRLGARTWSIPAKAYGLSGPDNHHQHAVTRRPDRPEPSHRVEPATGDPATPAASAPGPASSQGAGDHRPQRTAHQPRHGRPFMFKQRLGARNPPRRQPTP